jgi:hypothetical protein
MQWVSARPPPLNNYIRLLERAGICSVTLTRSGGGPRLCFVKYSCVETKPIILP